MAVCMEELWVDFSGFGFFRPKVFSVQQSLTKKVHLSFFQGNCWLKIPLESWSHGDYRMIQVRRIFPMATVVIVTSQGVAYHHLQRWGNSHFRFDSALNSRGAPTKNLNWGTGKHFIRICLEPCKHLEQTSRTIHAVKVTPILSVWAVFFPVKKRG